MKHVDKTIDTSGEKHSDRTITLNRMQFSFFWDPFLNGTRTAQFIDGSLSKVVGGNLPTLAVVGSGIWYLRHPDAGGIAAWKVRVDAIFAAVSPNANIIADEVVLMPVENAIRSRLSPERAATLHLDDIKAMNDHLDLRLRGNSAISRPTLAIPRVFNALIEGMEEETMDGLHFSDPISKVQASILLNLRCNDVLPKTFPFDKTCCSQYPTPNWVQLVLVLFFLSWAPAGLYFHSKRACIPYPSLIALMIH